MLIILDLKKHMTRSNIYSKFLKSNLNKIRINEYFLGMTKRINFKPKTRLILSN